jgi:hypothetical protein
MISAALSGLPWVALAMDQGLPKVLNQVLICSADQSGSCETLCINTNLPCTSTTYVDSTPTPTQATEAGNTDLNQTTATSSTLSPSTSKHKPNSNAIVGGVVGGVVFLAILAVMFFFLRRRKRRRNPKAHEGIPVLDKSRASSPASHASPVYGGAHPHLVGSAPPPPPAPVATYHGHQKTYDEPHQQPQQQLPPSQPIVAPAELQSREVDEDGVSVSSFDMQRPQESVPRLPVYQRRTPPGSSTVV